MSDRDSKVSAWVSPLIVFILYAIALMVSEGLALLDNLIENLIGSPYAARRSTLVVVVLVPIFFISYWFSSTFVSSKTYNKLFIVSGRSKGKEARSSSWGLTAIVFLLMALVLVVLYASRNFHM